MNPPRTIVDLTQPLGPTTVMWPGSQAPGFTNLENHREHGCFARTASLCEHSGTHVDAPAHFVEGGATIDEIPAERLVRPVAVIDVRAKTRDNPEYAMLVEDVHHNEALHGRILDGSVVLVCTGWGACSSDARQYLGLDTDGALHFPGIGAPAALWLVENRSICGIGIDTVGIDPGGSIEMPVHREVTLPRGVWHLEGLVNVEMVPARGAIIFVGVIPFAGGSGAPARVLAVM